MTLTKNMKKNVADTISVMMKDGLEKLEVLGVKNIFVSTSLPNREKDELLIEKINSNNQEFFVFLNK